MTFKINFTQIFILIILLIVSKIGISQSQKPISIGGEKWGVSFGTPKDYNGIKLNLFDNKRVEKINGLNLSIINTKIGTLKGLSISIIGYSSSFSGVQIAIINRTNGLNGVQIGVFNSDPYKCFVAPYHAIRGVQLGLFNKCNMNMGFQIGLKNRTGDERKGVSIGLININSKLQIGFFNIKGNRNEGIQIGVFNYRPNNKWFAKLLPIINLKIEKKNSEQINDEQI